MPGTELPKLKSRQEGFAEITEESPILALLSAFASSSGITRLPEYTDAGKVHTEAMHDFRRADYSSAADYIDSLVKIVDHWQTLAESMWEELKAHGATIDEYGSITFEPFVVVDSRLSPIETGDGTADYFDVADPDQREDAVLALEKLGAVERHPGLRERYAARIIAIREEI